MTTHGQPASRQTPRITGKQAEQNVSHYKKINNKANEQRTCSLTGATRAVSYSIDAGAHRSDRGSDPSGICYVPFAASRTANHIPRTAP